jgi:hypothetical protein
MSFRTQNERGAAQPAAQIQLDDCAFTVGGWAVEIPDDFSKDLTILNAYQPSATKWEKAVATAQENDEEPWRASLLLTQREVNEQSDGDVRRYLLVGLTLPNLNKEVLSRHPSQKKQRPVGTKLEKSALISTADSPEFVMVVTPIFDAEPEVTQLYALVKPLDGLCHPFIIGHKACFYLPQFRDNTTDLKSRGPSW